MVGYLPRELREELETARRTAQRPRGRMRLDVGGQTFTILRYWHTGFAVDAQQAPRLRGLVDLYDGRQHVAQCLILASAEDAGEMVYEFKRQTAALDAPPQDFAREESAPIALLPNDG